MIIKDMHLHSNYSDGLDSLTDMITEAIELNIQEIGFTDHVRRNSCWVDEYLNELKRQQEIYNKQIIIYPGVETKAVNWYGELDFNEVWANYPIRIVAAIHRIPTGTGQYISRQAIGQDIDFSKKAWLKTLEGLTHNQSITCLAHPFSLFEEMKIVTDDVDWWSKISEIIHKANFEIEYNVKYDNSLIPRWFFEKHRYKFVPASDSHSVEALRKMSLKIYQLADIL